MEEKMISDLQKTMVKKEAAIGNLKMKSPALQKQMEPRQAYKSKQDGSANQTQTQGFGDSYKQ
jgi:hypothetical protein